MFPNTLSVLFVDTLQIPVILGLICYPLLDFSLREFSDTLRLGQPVVSNRLGIVIDMLQVFIAVAENPIRCFRIGLLRNAEQNIIPGKRYGALQNNCRAPYRRGRLDTAMQHRE